MQNNIEPLIMTIIPIASIFALSHIGQVLTIIVFVVYWIPEIKEKRVDKHYGGSWLLWIKGILKIFKKN